MASHGRSLSDCVTPVAPATMRESLLLTRAESVASLTAPETLRLTLALSRTESYWLLTHSSSVPKERRHALTEDHREREPPQPSALVTALDVSVHSSRPHKVKSLPSDIDYRRMQLRLDKIISGTAFSCRSMQLVEGKPVDVDLDAGEQQYFRVKTLDMQTPMKVAVKKQKGKVVAYLSKSVQEPKDPTYDEVFTKDTVVFTEPSSRFKQQWVFLGFHCLEETALTLSLHFGSKHRKHFSATRLPILADLNEYRKNEAKYQALAKRVEDIQTQRQLEHILKYSDRNYIHENRLTLGLGSEDITEKRTLESQKREKAIRRHFEYLKEKKIRAQTILKRRELRLEQEARERRLREEREKTEMLQRRWLCLTTFLTTTESLFDLFEARKSALEQAGKRVKAAVVLQRCYRKVILTINPRRLVKQHAMHHLLLYLAHIGPSTKDSAKSLIFSTIVESLNIKCRKTLFDEYYNRSVRKARMETLIDMWKEAAKAMVQALVPPGRKSSKSAKLLDSKLRKVDQHRVLSSYLQSCQRQFYQRISAYIHASKAFRQGIKAFIFAKLKRGESVYLSGAPDFIYKMTQAEMQRMIQTAAEFV